MTEHHRTTEYDEIDFHEELDEMLPNENAITTLSLKDYFFQVYERHWEDRVEIAQKVIELLDHLPKLKTNLQQRDLLEMTLRDCGCEIPEGLGDLPLIWAEPIVNFIHKTEWALYPETNAKVVFGWKCVKSVRGSLEITFPSPIPHPDFNWEHTAPLLLRLHNQINRAVLEHWVSCEAKI